MNLVFALLVAIGVAVFGGSLFFLQTVVLPSPKEEPHISASLQEENVNVAVPEENSEQKATEPGNADQQEELVAKDMPNEAAVKAMVEIPPSDSLKVTKPETLPTPDSSRLSVSQINQMPFKVLKNTWAFSSAESFEFPTEKRSPADNFVFASNIPERPIDPQSVVLVRCKFTGTYTGSAAGAQPQPIFALGSGVLISPEGHILTVGHLIRDQEMNKINQENQDTTIIWKRDSCQAAPTDAQLTPIDSNPHVDPEDSRFMPADVVFEPTDAMYNPYKFEDPDRPGKILYFDGGSDLDFAVLQVHDAHLPFVPVIKKLAYIGLGEALIGLGYPGLATNDAQSLERIDGQFTGFSFMQSSSCNSKTVLEECGLNYQTKRYKEDYKSLYGKQTNLGKYTSYFRGGFSGGPLFYKGNVAGILVTSMENPYTNLYDLTAIWNWVDARATSEIVPILEARGIPIATVP